MRYRAFLSGIAYAAAFVGSPIVVAVAAVLILVRYRAWEVVFLGFLIDTFYLPHYMFMFVPFPTTLIMLVLLYASAPLRARLRT